MTDTLRDMVMKRLGLVFTPDDQIIPLDICNMRSGWTYSVEQILSLIKEREEAAKAEGRKEMAEAIYKKWKIISNLIPEVQEKREIEETLTNLNATDHE